MRRVRALQERAMHPLRRYVARRRARLRGPVGSALFVCHGNICRSPFAAAAFERAFREQLPGYVAICSAGLVGSGRRAPPEAVRAAARHGYDLSSHRSSAVDAARLSSDIIVVADPLQCEALRRRFGPAAGAMFVLGDFDPQSNESRAIRDPLGADDTIFEESFARIERCVGELVRAMASSPSPARH